MLAHQYYLFHGIKKLKKNWIKQDMVDKYNEIPSCLVNLFDNIADEED